MPIDKVTNLKDLEYYNNMQLCSSLVKKWRKLKPNNKELKSFDQNLLEVTLYVVEIQRDIAFHKEAISDYRQRANQAQLDLRELKDKHQELKDKYEKLLKDYKQNF